MDTHTQIGVFCDEATEVVELQDMLDRRETRQLQQQALLAHQSGVLLSFALNIPGPIKTSILLHKLFQEALELIKETLEREKISIVNDIVVHEKTGDEYIVLLKGDAYRIKELMCNIEETHACGRLFDIDVIDEQGCKLSRKTYRRCLLCDHQAQDCARNRTHSVDELCDAISILVSHHLKD